MSDTSQIDHIVESLDRADGPLGERGGFDRRAFLRRTALTGAAVGGVSSILSACGSSASSRSSIKMGGRRFSPTPRLPSNSD